MDQIEYKRIVNFLRKGDYPEEFSRQAKWNFKEKVSKYFISESDKLYKKVVMSGEEKDIEVACRADFQDILERFHDRLAHPGINSSVISIRQRYYWPGMYSQITDYVKTCDLCQRTAALPPQPQRKLQPIPPPDRPWQHIGIDLICDLPLSPEGYKHILVTVCYLSKYVVVRPLKSKTSSEVVENLKDIYLDIGLPDIIQHDQGKEFTSNLFQEYHQKCAIDNRSTRAYHPMANGLVEAHNKILKTKLNKMATQTGDHWSVLLKSAVLCMNSTVKKSHSYTPFQVMWGRESRYEDLVPALNNIQVSHEEDFELEQAVYSEFLLAEEDCEMDDVFSSLPSNDMESIKLIDESRECTRSFASNSIKSEQLKQKRQYDKKVTEKKHEIKEGDKIIFTNMPKLKKMPKTQGQDKYLGPFTTSRITDSHAVISKEELGSKKDKKVPIHIARPYHQRCSSSKSIAKKRKADDTSECESKRNKTSMTPLVEFGFSSETIHRHLSQFKIILQENVRKGTFITPLHEDLHSLLNRFHLYVPNIFIFHFLKDSNEEQMKQEIRETVLSWTTEIYPKFGDTLAAKYAEKVLYGIAIQYLNTMLWETFPDDLDLTSPEIPIESPKISILSEDWIKGKCQLYGLQFESLIRQPENLIGKSLSGYQPLETERIAGDGNCLYRCFSKIITGSQDYHPELRALISNYLASEGTTGKMAWYFKQKQITPCNYLLDETLTYLDGAWGSDVEIMAFSAILNADIYVGNNDSHRQGSLIREVRWNLIRASKNPEVAIYIQNFNLHYEPVISMMNSPTPSYGATSDDVMKID